ncbi:DNA gyrase inhibitor YacG [Rubrivivax gelatinosus]|uniref:DNA gyrase inhibitor YacG n=1 Tax=Rubrivivax gelatinosus TaxID=28068 RepID=A0ABS1DYF5_RUBGE|nr:DNA gyrase inhibitor YacG [Rubrivivax gelatinosus]
MTASPRLVPCPACKKPSPFVPENRWRPFCSERCRNLDLGAWASESYRVAAAAPPDAGEDTPPPAAAH